MVRLFLVSMLALGAVPAQTVNWITSPVNGHHYALVLTPMTWHQARVFAQSQGSHLAVIRNQAENDWLDRNVRFLFPAFIGCTDEVQEGQWRWVTGEPFGYTNWAPGQPDNFGPSGQHYGVMWNAPTGTWDDQDATRLLPSILERPAQTVTWTTSPVNGHDYALVFAPMTWHQARVFAQSQGGHLAVIRNQTENDWVAQNMLFPFVPAFIGCTDEVQEGQWRWVTGEPFGYTNWAPGQPDNFGPSGQHYGVMWHAPTGTWDDQDATRLLPFIIERPRAVWIPYGQGCVGSNGVPGLGSTTPPRLGSTVRMDLTGLPASPGLIFGIVGFSRTAWGSLPLPLALDPYGMAGCSAFVAPPPPGWTTGIMHGGGSATWTETVPNATLLLGVRVYLQAFVPDPGAPNPRGATVSNALEGRLGY